MDAPAEDLTDNASSLSLETVELELAFRSQDPVQSGFEGALKQALEKSGGSLLFHMRVDEGQTRWIAAVSVGSGEDRQFLIVTIPSSGEIVIEPLDSSNEPLARIASSFANVMEKLQVAA